MQAQRDNISNLIVSEFWLFSSYSVICSPWWPLREIQSKGKNKLFSCCSTRQSCLCHRPSSNMSENTKTRLLKASCHLPVCHSVAAIKRRGSIILIWTLASPSIVLLSLQFTVWFTPGLYTLPNSFCCDLEKLLQLSLLLLLNLYVYLLVYVSKAILCKFI